MPSSIRNIAIVAELLGPLQSLLSTKNEFTWSPDLNQAFVAAKQSPTSVHTYSFIDQAGPHASALTPAANNLDMCFNTN